MRSVQASIFEISCLQAGITQYTHTQYMRAHIPHPYTQHIDYKVRFAISLKPKMYGDITTSKIFPWIQFAQINTFHIYQNGTSNATTTTRNAENLTHT